MHPKSSAYFLLFGAKIPPPPRLVPLTSTPSSSEQAHSPSWFFLRVCNSQPSPQLETLLKAPCSGGNVTFNTHGNELLYSHSPLDTSSLSFKSWAHVQFPYQFHATLLATSTMNQMLCVKPNYPFAALVGRWRRGLRIRSKWAQHSRKKRRYPHETVHGSLSASLCFYPSISLYIHRCISFVFL